MIIDESNYTEIISSYSDGDWQPLFDLIPEIEEKSQFGEVTGGEEIEEGVFNFPHISESDVVSKFHDIVYGMSVIISFDWGSWDEGRRMVNDESFDYNSIDIPAKCKIITAIVRNDRFCEGALVSAFESGLILKVLKSIKNQLNYNTFF